MRAIWIGLMAPLVLAGCDQPEENASSGRVAGGTTVTVATPTDGPVAAPPVVAIDKPVVPTPFADAWLGKWVGVEGLALTIARGDRPDTYRLHIALLDGANDYIGTADGETIRFERDGQTATIRATTGAETGLKWLAEKQNCLTIREGEGFCRD